MKYPVTIWQSSIVDATYKYNIEASDADEAKEKARKIVENGIDCANEDGFDHFEWGGDSELNPNGTTEISIEGEGENIVIPNVTEYKKKLFVSDIGDDATEALFKCIKQYNEQATEKGLPNIKVDFNAVRQENNKYKVECFITVKSKKE